MLQEFNLSQHRSLNGPAGLLEIEPRVVFGCPGKCYEECPA